MNRVGLAVAATVLALSGPALAAAAAGRASLLAVDHDDPVFGHRYRDISAFAFEHGDVVAVREGRSEDDVVAAKPFADLDAKWARSELAGRNFFPCRLSFACRQGRSAVVQAILPQE